MHPGCRHDRGGSLEPTALNPSATAKAFLRTSWYPLGQVIGGCGGVGAAGGRSPHQDARFRLRQPPAFRLFCAVVVPAERSKIALAGEPALIPRDRVVQVTAGGGTAAAWRGAGSGAGPDEVLEGAAGVVAGLGAGVVAGTAGDGDQRGLEGEGIVRGADARGRVAAAEAGVGGGSAVRVQRGEAPPGAGMAGGGCRQVACVVAVEDPVPVGFAGGVGAALVGGQGDGDGDQGGQAGAGVRGGAGSGAGTARAAAGTAGTARAAAGSVGSVGVCEAGAGAGRTGWGGVQARLVRGGAGPGRVPR